MRTAEVFHSRKKLASLLDEKGNCLTYELENNEELQQSRTKKNFLQISKRNFFFCQFIRSIVYNF